MDADFAVTHQDHAAVVALSGELDAANAGLIRSALEQQLPRDMATVVLDLSALTYIDSAGIHLLFALARRSDAHGQAMRLVVPPGSPVEATLSYVNATAMFGVDRALSDAIGASG